MKLQSDPYQIFWYSRTPAGLYARQKWLGEGESSQWKTVFKETAGLLLADQSPDGSWHHETATTTKHLFGLHLTVRSSNPEIESALARFWGTSKSKPVRFTSVPKLLSPSII